MVKILDRNYVVESDHAAFDADIGWNVIKNVTEKKD